MPGTRATSLLPCLVVDDEPGVQATFRLLLRGTRRRIVVAATGREAVRQFAGGPWEVVFLDYHLQGPWSGPDLLEILNERYPELLRRVIMISGAFEEASADPVVRDLGVPVLGKPFSVRNLQRVILFLNRVPELRHTLRISPKIAIRREGQKTGSDSNL